jgi:hypothetical protein
VGSGGVRVDETIPCAFSGSGVALERVIAALSADGSYQAVQVAPDRLQFARTFHPTWALVLGVLTLPAALLGVVFLLFRTTETCTAVVEADHRGTRIRLAGKLNTDALGRIRTALTDGAAPVGRAGGIGQPVASAFEAGAPPFPRRDPSPQLIDLPGTVLGEVVPPVFGCAAPLTPLAIDPQVHADAPSASWPPPAPFASAPASTGWTRLGGGPADAESTLVPERHEQPSAVPVLLLDDGQQLELARHNLLGRDPVGSKEDADARLLPVLDQTRSVSKTHLAVSYRDGAWSVEDRHSTNGTILVGADGVARRVRPGEPTEVPAGSWVRFGERSFRIVVGQPS